jgi:glutathione S-transferase
LEQPLWRISRHTALYPEEQRLPGDVILASGEFKDMASVLEKHMQGRQFVASDSRGFCDGLHARLGQRVQTAGQLPAAAGLHEAHVRSPACAAAHRRSFRSNFIGTKFRR